jgi:hypothetical protein
VIDRTLEWFGVTRGQVQFDEPVHELRQIVNVKGD